MITRFVAFTLVFAAVLLQAGQMNQGPSHIEFSLVRGSAGFTSPKSDGMMKDAPYTVLAFAGEDRHRTLVITDTTGDYTAVLQPGRYCVSAYLVKTGELIPLDPRQLKCIDVLVGKDVRLDVMLGSVKSEKAPGRK